jgi:hypothetical protein
MKIATEPLEHEPDGLGPVECPRIMSTDLNDLTCKMIDCPPIATTAWRTVILGDDRAVAARYHEEDDS